MIMNPPLGKGDLGTMAQRHQHSPGESRTAAPALLPASCTVLSCEVYPASSGVLTTATGAKLLAGGGRESPTLPFTEHTLVWLGCTQSQ